MRRRNVRSRGCLGSRTPETAGGMGRWLLLVFALVVAMATGSCTEIESRSRAADPASRNEPDGQSTEMQGPPDCGEPRTTGIVSSGSIRECSGLAHSRSQPVIWLHNDSGDGPRFYAIDTTGSLRATVRLAGAVARDWEDIAVGPCPGGGDAVFLGDIGDNLRVRYGIRVYRVPEPRLAAEPREIQLLVEQYDVLELWYPDGPHDAEAMFVTPETGDVYVLTKETEGHSGLYRASFPAVSSRASMTRVLQLNFGAGELSGSPSPTAGDMSSDGSRILVRTYDRVFLFANAAGSDPGSLLATHPYRLPAPTQAHGEAIAFAPDGRSYYTLSEGTAQPLQRVDCR